MANLRGLPRLRSLLALTGAAAIIPLALWLAAEVGVATACVYWSLSVAIPIAASVSWAYAQLAVEPLVDRFS